MFGELPKLFDRNFVIAYFLPASVFLAVEYVLAVKLGMTPAFFTLTSESVLKDAFLFGLLSWFGGMVLLLFNRGLVRLLEGYWPFGLEHRLNFLEKRRYRKVLSKLDDSDRLKAEYQDRGQELPSDLQRTRNKLKLLEAEGFPEREGLLLPTSFGNAFRAFEVYPRVMYGLDAIPGWYRLLAVIPSDYRELMDSSRARLDFWINVWFLAITFALCSLIVAFYSNGTIQFWPYGIANRLKLVGLAIVSLVFSRIAFLMARNAAIGWGRWVKGGFDVYLWELRLKLGFPYLGSNADEKAQWARFSRAIIYRDSPSLPERSEQAKTQSATPALVQKQSDF